MPALRPLLLVLALVFLTACAHRPDFDTSGVALTLTPQQAIGEAPRHLGETVLWGGMVIQTSNLPSGTRLEVLAYPLGSNHEPRLNQPPLGRFMIDHEGYLESVDYASGRRISVLGKLEAIEDGMVDQSPYRFPVVQARQLHLWPRGEPAPPRVHFGIGVVFGR